MFMLLDKIKGLCYKYGIRPEKAKGQNFLICEDALADIIEISELKKDDLVLEIGPGFGFLTKLLAKSAKRVIAVELDTNLAGVLKKELANFNNIDIINKDILNFSSLDLEDLLSQSNLSENKKFFPYKLISNLPYNITSAVLKKFLSMAHRPQKMALMVQKEVAERVCAPKGEKSLLSVTAQYYAEPKFRRIVPASCFYPQPEVESAILELDIKKQFLDSFKAEEKDFFWAVKVGFSARRKMLKNNLINGLKGMGKKVSPKDMDDLFKKIGFNEKIRAQELGIEDWEKLREEMKKIFKI